MSQEIAPDPGAAVAPVPPPEPPVPPSVPPPVPPPDQLDRLPDQLEKLPQTLPEETSFRDADPVTVLATLVVGMPEGTDGSVQGAAARRLRVASTGSCGAAVLTRTTTAKEGGAVTVEESAYLGFGQPRRAEQIVVRGRLTLNVLVGVSGERATIRDLLFFGWERGLNVEFEKVDDTPTPTRPMSVVTVKSGLVEITIREPRTTPADPGVCESGSQENRTSSVVRSTGCRLKILFGVWN